MNKLHSFAIYALTTPVIALGASSVLAQQTTGQEPARQQQSSERSDDATKSEPRTTQGGQGAERTGQPGVRAGQSGERAGQSEAGRAMGEKSRMESRGYMDATPAQGLRASDLIGAKVNTTGDENVGPVNDLIVDENGQVVAIVIGVGGFLGMGQKDVAIGWDDVTRSGDSDSLELRVNATRDDLRDAPEFKKRN